MTAWKPGSFRPVTQSTLRAAFSPVIITKAPGAGAFAYAVRGGMAADSSCLELHDGCSLQQVDVVEGRH